jgi:thymidylate synthase
LKEQGVKIWDGNGSKEFLNSLGFKDREEGDLGPVYGFQWRHWGATYEDKNTSYEGKGIDQVQILIDKIKNNPNDRRLIISGWNVSDLNLMALPPCHLLSQFYVDENTKELSCQLYQRSADMFLGVPFNIASYATLTHLIAHFTGLKASSLHITFGDAHVYNNHEHAVIKQLIRQPYKFPKIEINPDTTLETLKYSDVKLHDYKAHESIYAPMAI